VAGIKRVISLVILIITMIILMACGAVSEVTVAPDAQLVSFLPSYNESYTGDSSYFHVVKSIETESTDTRTVAIIKGEVRDNSTSKMTKDFTFEVKLSVDHERIRQTYDGNELNETVFSDLVLLERPIEVGHLWTFNTTNDTGKKVKVTGEIIKVESEGEVVTIKYSTKDGYYEERTLVKGRGTTDFTRLVVFKNERSITGYHSEIGVSTSVSAPEDPMNSTEPTKENEILNEVKIPVAAYNLILGFDQAWSPFIKKENDDLLKFIAMDSPAYEKINAVTRDSATAIEFIKYYPYEVSTDETYTIVKVVETFKTAENEVVENQVQYKIIVESGIFKIYDFEIVD